MSISVHIVLLLLMLGFVFTETPDPKIVQHAVIVDFSQLDDISDMPDEKPAPKAETAKEKPQSAKSAPAAAPRAVKVKETPRQPLRTSQKPKAATPVKVTEQESPIVQEVIPPTTSPEELEAQRRAKEKAEKKSMFSSLLSKSKGKGKSKDADTSNEEAEALANKGNELLTSGSANTNTGKGILGHRKVLKTPVIQDKSQKKGRVVVEICVNAAGKVVSADYTMLGSTTTDAYLIGLAEKGAMQYVFTKSDNPKECGKVTIDFQLK